jgi:hypothetical protein
MSKSFMSTGIAELLMRWTSPNQILSVKRGECPEAIYSNNLTVYILFIIICTFLQCSPEGVCSKITHNALIVMNRELVWQTVFCFVNSNFVVFFFNWAPPWWLYEETLGSFYLVSYRPTQS